MSEQLFTPIRISTLRGDLKISFDLFIKVAGKHILYCREGESFDGVRLKRLRDKRIRQLFITPDSEVNYREYLKQNIHEAFDPAPKKPLPLRAEIAHGLHQATTEEMMENPASKDHFMIFSADTDRHVRFLLQENEALKAILNVENPNQSVAHHGVNVASISIGIAQTLGITDQAIIEALAIGGLLHDIEHFHSGLNVARPVKEFNEAEHKIYLDHPMEGSARVQNIAFYPQQVVKIIQCHHETIAADGFPSKLKESELDEAVMITSVSDAFDRLISYQGHEQKTAHKKLMMDKVGALKLDYLKALGQMLRNRGIA